MYTNEELMHRCLKLAKNGRGNTNPNPLVGCVIVKNGMIIGEGYHKKFGEAHAEVNAIRSALENVEGSEVYVNLEPCSFYGKTPPCTDLLIEKRIKKVYVAMLDPNPRVNGNGVKKLRDAGIEVEVGLLQEDAQQLNEAFTKFITKKLPFVTLKIAQSLDGKIALRNGKSKYITSEESLKKVHELRAEHAAVLVGAGTVKSDNPELTVRLAEGRHPARIILDGNLSLPIDSKVFSDGKIRTILFYSARSEKVSKSARRKLEIWKNQGVETYPLRTGPNGKITVHAVLKKTAELGIASLLVEGGTSVFSQFIKSGLADKLHLFVAPKILGDGKGFADEIELKNLSQAVKLRKVEVTQIGDDQLITGYF